MADLCNMSRKTRTRQTRIHAALQSGYCAICHLPYNSLDDHIQSKKHLKLIGEDANYISINGFIDQNSLDPFLNLNGIESIDINGRHIEKDYSKRSTRNKCRGTSLERFGPSPIDSPAHHHLRSRKQINYAMSPSLDDDSLSEKAELIFKAPVKERKEKRISCKNVEPVKVQDVSECNTNSEVWNSGRPKRRSCIRSKRASADERLVVDNKTYYKVEVMSTKLRSNSNTKEYQEVKHNNETLEKDDKGLIVKFKKLRHSEITLLNNEAENFLFPKKDDDSSSSSGEEDEADIDADGANTTVSSTGDHQDSFLPSSDTEEYKTKDSFKVEDEGSMDSTTSSGKTKKKRRTHAEAFIMDNEKYYKFETPGSRYHGSFFSELDLKSQKYNGNLITKEEKMETDELEEEKIKRLNLENYQFAFEMVPSGEKWYSAFRRQDLGQESYMYLPDDSSGNRFILPYQVGSIPALDPKVCMSQYVQLKKLIQENSTASGSRTSCSTPEPSENNYTPSPNMELMDDDSKLSEPGNSIEFCSENSNSEDGKIMEIKKLFKRGRMPMSRNPRKSPRQHASTLAILSSLIQQRKRRSKSGEPSSSTSVTVQKCNILAPIPEDAPIKSHKTDDYDEILHSINQEWDFEKLTEDMDVQPEGDVEFSNKLGILDVLQLYDRLRMKDDYRNNRKFINGCPGRKPGRRKMNKTGWPNRKKCLIRKDHGMKEESSSHGSVNDSEEEPNTTDSIKNVNKVVSNEIVNENCDLNRVQVRESVKDVKSMKVKLSSVKKNMTMQPIVKVRKLDPESVVTKDASAVLTPKKTYKRRMPASPKSPRMLRKPRGKWYKER
ncbi:hypothetical protein WA026_011979 [Henosepilachna vigintioctopunctata]|uniref:DBF4-type domain-containing protein n=1 Tax=Henosepilachna vigintioctopunctata TaxID=420089 RepID=A0AAW1VC82_9CUCU